LTQYQKKGALQGIRRFSSLSNLRKDDNSVFKRLVPVGRAKGKRITEGGNLRAKGAIRSDVGI